jgi:hypothetical protein
VSLRRDRRLVRSLLLWRVRASGCVKAVLLFLHRWALSSHPKEALRLFGEALRTGREKAALLFSCPTEGVMVAQAIKRCARRRVVKEVSSAVLWCGVPRRRCERGSWKASGAPTRSSTPLASKGCKSHLSSPSGSAAGEAHPRRGARRQFTLEAGMWLVGSCYDFCWTHRSLLRRGRGAGDPPGGRWVEAPRPRLLRASAIIVGRSKSC